jgi:hypothetical protein
MTWFLALQGTAHMTNQPSVYELQDSADVDKIAQELVSSATLDRAVPIPAVLQQNAGGKQSVTLNVRPAAWGMWGVLPTVRRGTASKPCGEPVAQRALPGGATTRVDIAQGLAEQL